MFWSCGIGVGKSQAEWRAGAAGQEGEADAGAGETWPKDWGVCRILRTRYDATGSQKTFSNCYRSCFLLKLRWHCFPILLVQYVIDVRTVQKRLLEVEESIVFINKEEALYNWDLTVYPEVDVIKENIEPYQKLFGLVLKWQRTEKRFGRAPVFCFYFSVFLLRRCSAVYKFIFWLWDCYILNYSMHTVPVCLFFCLWLCLDGWMVPS